MAYGCHSSCARLAAKKGEKVVFKNSDSEHRRSLEAAAVLTALRHASTASLLTVYANMLIPFHILLSIHIIPMQQHLPSTHVSAATTSATILYFSSATKPICNLPWAVETLQC
ncbi:hypothetical protein VNO80_18523 [Phaseolus coccineus]|uniref:Uncharacterized protein n=1 Tax=Phaseolus coccineus TaxID=3886 RepID=A0AAN9QZ03_PHACN